MLISKQCICGHGLSALCMVQHVNRWLATFFTRQSLFSCPQDDFFFDFQLKSWKGKDREFGEHNIGEWTPFLHHIRGMPLGARWASYGSDGHKWFIQPKFCHPKYPIICHTKYFCYMQFSDRNSYSDSARRQQFLWICNKASIHDDLCDFTLML